QYLYRGAYWRRGPVTMSAIAAVDTALWDINGKVAKLPIYQLLGGRSRTGVMVYGHANGKDIAETLDEVARYAGMGYKAIRAQSGVPGLASTYGVSKDRMYYEPADAAIPTENIWSTSKYLDHAPKLFDAIRARFGFEHHILHDVHHRLTPIEAGRLGKAPETDAVFPHAYWYDEGYLHPGEAPGHGVDIDEKLAAKYPYKPSALPVNRLEDGSMWNW